jgi:hypothetical protein
MLDQRLSDVGRLVAPSERLSVQQSARAEQLLASCPALLHLSDKSTADDDHMKALLAKIALRYSHDPWVQYERLVNGRFLEPHTPRQPGESLQHSPNRGFYESDVIGYEALAMRERSQPSMHARGGETAQERFLTMPAPGDSPEQFAQYREQLTMLQGRQLAVEMRIASLAQRKIAGSPEAAEGAKSTSPGK